MDVIKYHAPKGMVYGLMVKKTKKEIHLILNEPPIKVIKVKITEEKFITVMDELLVKNVKKAIMKAGKDYHKMMKRKNIRDALSMGEDEEKVKLGKMSKETLDYLKATA
jgi:hypothetical protein